MRGAGCVYNDIVDRDLDRQVARTRSRPLAAGAVSLKAAWIWLVALCLIGLVVLLQLHPYAAIVALVSLAPVAAYPFMKRITWWPQAWLGIVFSWGALVGWSEVDGVARRCPGPLLYLGSIFWVIGYDTIYALQDVEDDALVGVRSSARALGSGCKSGRRDLLRARARLLGARRSGNCAPTRWCSSRCCPPRSISRGRSRRSLPPTAPTRSTASARTAMPGC